MWDVVIILATIYVAIIVPYNAAFYGAGGVLEERGETAELTLQIKPRETFGSLLTGFSIYRPTGREERKGK